MSGPAPPPCSHPVRTLFAALEVTTGKVVDARLAKHPQVTLHFTPTSRCWLNLIEVFFGILTRQAIRRGTFTSVADR